VAVDGVEALLGTERASYYNGGCRDKWAPAFFKKNFYSLHWYNREI
jgi:hypothetical protein